jgi:hypothetical protein
MAVTYTASVASGYSTNWVYYDAGPMLVLTGHYSAPSNATGIIESQMLMIKEYYVQDADPTTYVQSANANGTIALIFSGMVTGATGYFELKGH